MSLPTTHRTLRRLGLGAATITLGLGLTACGSSAPSESDLEGALLTAGDLPSGFEEAPESDDDSDLFDGTCFEEISALSESPDFEEDEEAEIEYSMESDAGQASATLGLGYYEEEETLTRAFDTFAETVASCSEVSTSSEGVDIDLTLTSDEEVDVTDADQQINAVVSGTISAQGQEVPIEIALAFVRVGSSMSSISTFSLAGATEALDVHDDLVEEQTANLVELVG